KVSLSALPANPTFIAVLRDGLAGFLGALTFVATDVDCGNRVGIGFAGGDHAIAIGWRLHQVGIQLDGRAVLFGAIDIVSGEIGVGHRRPDEINKWLLSLARIGRL